MDDGIATPLAGSSVDPTGDTATATLAAGQLIFLTIDISNLNGDLVTDLSLTLIFQGDQVDFLGGVAIAEVLVGGPLSAPTSLGRIAHPHIKIAQPNLPGTVGDIWLQALGYAGPQPNAEGCGTRPFRNQNFEYHCNGPNTAGVHPEVLREKSLATRGLVS